MAYDNVVLCWRPFYFFKNHTFSTAFATDMCDFCLSNCTILPPAFPHSLFRWHSYHCPMAIVVTIPTPLCVSPGIELFACRQTVPLHAYLFFRRGTGGFFLHFLDRTGLKMFGPCRSIIGTRLYLYISKYKIQWYNHFSCWSDSRRSTSRNTRTNMISK